MQEGQYWLDLLHETQYLDDKQYTSLNDDSVEIIKMLTAAIKKLNELFSPFRNSATKNDSSSSDSPAGEQPVDIGILSKSIRRALKDTIPVYPQYSSLEFWTLNNVTYSLLKSDEFENRLREDFDNWNIRGMADCPIVVHLSQPAASDNCIPICDGLVQYRITLPADDSQQEQILKAVISAVDGFGSLESSVTLDPQRSEPYHIGRGTFSQETGFFRKNDIVIRSDDNDPEQNDRNRHVSRAHADILFHSNQFCIKALPGGCRSEGGSPTKIIRNGAATELRDTKTLFCLKDGDMIELGKSVIIIFRLCDKTI